MAIKQKSVGNWMGQDVVFPGIVEHFGKNYVWLQDRDNTLYMLPLDENNVPQFV